MGIKGRSSIMPVGCQHAPQLQPAACWDQAHEEQELQIDSSFCCELIRTSVFETTVWPGAFWLGLSDEKCLSIGHSGKRQHANTSSYSPSSMLNRNMDNSYGPPELQNSAYHQELMPGLGISPLHSVSYNPQPFTHNENFSNSLVKQTVNLFFSCSAIF